MNSSTAIERLDEASPFRMRLRAAEWLARHGRREDGARILRALHAEVEAGVTDRNWELVDLLLMAVGKSGYAPAGEELMRLATSLDLADQPMVRLGLGDAIVRLCRKRPHDPAPLLWCTDSGDDELRDGAFRAAAMLREVYDEETCSRLLASLAGVEEVEPIGTFRFWPAAAAAGWPGAAVQNFLTSCLTSERDELREAAALSLRGTYEDWEHL